MRRLPAPDGRKNRSFSLLGTDLPLVPRHGQESFEDPGVAALLNREFVSIKVDREERPDIDSVYMGICQQMTFLRRPLTIVMTPEKKPFFAGTYFPKENRAGMPGLTDILREYPALGTVGRTN